VTAPDDLADVDPTSAQEILRQAQAVILAQADALKGIEAKSTSLLQASLSLATASLGGAAFTLGNRGVTTSLALPVWAGTGLGVAGLVFAMAALRAAWALRPTNVAIGAIRPGELLNAGNDRQPAKRVFLALAYELERAISANDRLGRLAAARFESALRTALLAPLRGVGLAAIVGHSGRWELAAGAVAVCSGLRRPRQPQRLAGRLSGSRFGGAAEDLTA
jgi:hypothetical protein